MTIANLSPGLSNLLIGIFLLELSIGAVLWWWLAKTKGAQLKATQPKSDTIAPDQSYLIAIMALLLVLIITVTGGSILAQMDRPFYAAGGVGTSQWILTPAHYIMFLTCFPVYFITGALIYLLVKKHDPASLPKLKWFILVACLMPLMFIPAVNGDLLDNKVTMWETVYLGFYQAANIAWIAVGLVPVGLYAVRKILSGLGESA